MSHLDEGVESLAIHLQELRLNVQHVNLRPGDHYSDEDTICSAQPLTRESDRWYLWLDFVPACSYDIQYDNISLLLLFHYKHEIFTFIDLYNLSAKNAGLLLRHFTGEQKQKHMSCNAYLI